MREYVATGFNHMLAIDSDEGTVKPRVEVIIISSEPNYVVDAGGLRIVRSLIDHRVFMGADALRKIAEAFVEQADLLDRIDIDQPVKMRPAKGSGATVTRD